MADPATKIVFVNDLDGPDAQGATR
jgi:hypothetical protein